MVRSRRFQLAVRFVMLPFLGLAIPAAVHGILAFRATFEVFVFGSTPFVIAARDSVIAQSTTAIKTILSLEIGFARRSRRDGFTPVVEKELFSLFDGTKGFDYSIRAAMSMASERSCTYVWFARMIDATNRSKQLVAVVAPKGVNVTQGN